MSSPPERSSLSNYAAAEHSKANKAQAGAVAVAGAIGSSIARGAASWLSSAVSTVSEHLPAARSATQYYSYDAGRASAAAYKRAKQTLSNVAGGAVRVSQWMGLDLTDGGAAALDDRQQNGPDSPLSAEAGAVELMPGVFVPGESECHYTPRPTGLAGQVEISRVQVQLAPVFVSSTELYSHSSASSGGSGSSAAAAGVAAAADNENAMLCLSLVGPGGYPGFAIFRVDCSDVYEEVVELDLRELEALGPVRSVCVAEVVVPATSAAGSSSSSSSRLAAGGFAGRSGAAGVASVTHQRLAVVLTAKCILQYNIAQRRVVSFQALAFEAADLKLSPFFALVTHSGFGQVSVLSLYGKEQLRGSSSQNDLTTSPSRIHNGGGGNRSGSAGAGFAFSLDEIDLLVPDGDETALCDRWIAYVGSGSDAARTTTRLLCHAQRTTAENVSKNIHKGLAAVGGFLGAAVTKAMQVTGVSASPAAAAAAAAAAGRADGGGGGGDDDDGIVFNPRAIGLQPIDSSGKSIGTVVVRDLFARTDIAAFIAHDNPVSRMAFDATGTILATCANDGKHIHVFRVCPRGSATRSTTVAAAAAATLSRSMPLRMPSGASLYGLGAPAGGGGGGGGSGGGGSSSSPDDLSGSTATPTTSGGAFPSGPVAANIIVSNNSNASSSNAAAPYTTIVFTHRIARGVTGGTVLSLSFSQPWSWLACTTSVGTAHFFRLDLDRLCNVEENLLAGEGGAQAAVNVAGASFRIRSAPATTPPNPVVCFFPGEAATGAGEQTTACVVTKAATVATAVVSSVSEKGVVLYERGAAQFAGPKRDNGIPSAAAAAVVSMDRAGSGIGVKSSASSGIGGGAGGGSAAAAAARYMTAEAAWMELLHRRTQPAFAPLYAGVKVQPLPEPQQDDEEEEDDH